MNMIKKKAQSAAIEFRFAFAPLNPHTPPHQ